MSDEEVDQESVALQKFRVSVVISCLGSERRIVQLGERSQEQIQEIIKMIDASLATVRVSNSISFTDTNGLVTFANLNNVAFVEVQVV